MNPKAPWLIGTLRRITVFDHDRREGGCGSSIHPKGNCASRKLIASGTSTRSLSSRQYAERLAKPRRSEAQGRENNRPQFYTQYRTRVAIVAVVSQKEEFSIIERGSRRSRGTRVDLFPLGTVQFGYNFYEPEVNTRTNHPERNPTCIYV